MATNSFLIALTIIIVIVAIFLILLALFGKDQIIGGADAERCSVPPSQPLSMELSNPLADIIAVQWNPSINADSYRIYLSETEEFLLSHADEVKVTSQTSISFGNLNTGATYYIKVTGVNPCGESPPSEEKSLTLEYIWPNRFQIINKSDVELDISVNGSDQLIVTTDCLPGDCWWEYNIIDKTIRKANNSNECLVRNGGNALAQPCTFGSLNDRQWSYSSQNETICLLDNNSICLRLPFGFVKPGDLEKLIEVGINTEDFLSQWTILNV